VKTISLVFCVYAGIVCSTTLTPGAQETRPATETPTATESGFDGTLGIQVLQPVIPIDSATFIVILLIALLALLFWLLLRWSQKSEQAAYLGQVYADSVQQFEYNRLLVPIRQKRERGEYEREVQESEWMTSHFPPEQPEPDEDLIPYLRSYYGPGGWPTTEPPAYYGYGGGGPYPPGGTQMPGDGGPGSQSRTGGLGGYTTLEDGDSWGSSGLQEGRDQSSQHMPEQIKEKYKAFRKEQHQYEKAYRKWDSDFRREVLRLYELEVNAAREKAEENAKLAIDVDFAVLRGRGHAFVLEFTAIVVIIFAAVITGVLGILTGEQIGTLLAAIAGYVLGRATTRRDVAAQEGGERARPTSEDSGGAGGAIQARRPMRAEPLKPMP
jgi:hypothetical protein